MKITWPPSEHDGWSIEEKNEPKNIFYFPFFRHDTVLLSINIINYEFNDSIKAKVFLQNGNYFDFVISYNTWTPLPFPIETHANGTFWSHITVDSSNRPFQIEWGFFPWNQRQFRMRGLIDENGVLLGAYRFNKNGQLITFIPIKDEQMTLPEDTILLPQVKCINTQSVILQSSRTTIQTKKPNPQLCLEGSMTLTSVDSV
jgi:hypothetical protein